MTKQQAIQLAGSKAKLARLLGITPGAIFHWKEIPVRRVYELKEKKPEWFGL
jgi:DNA-binding transcriptional regulator YdaS (Cro superfamily)